MAFIIVPENELYHHGILGQKWGVRRFQNADGSLTNAGKRKYGTKSNFNKVQAAKKAASSDVVKAKKARAKAEATTQKEIAKYRKKAGLKDEDKKTEANAKPESESTKPKTKSVGEMTDDEIRSKITRIQLENQLKSLQPEKTSLGKQFLQASVNDVILPAAKNVGKQYLEKTLKDKLGLDAKEAAETFGISKKALDQATREADYYGKLAKVAASKNTLDKLNGNDDNTNTGSKKKDGGNGDSDNENGKSDTKPKNPTDGGSSSDDNGKTSTGTVEGTGSSSRKDSSSSADSEGTYSWSRYGSDYDRSGQYSQKKTYEGTVESTKKAGSSFLAGDTKKTVVDAEYWSVNDEPKRSGQSYVNSVLGLPAGRSSSSNSNGSRTSSSSGSGSSKTGSTKTSTPSRASDLDDYTSGLLKSNAKRQSQYQSSVDAYKDAHPNTSMSDSQIRNMFKKKNK